MEVRSEVINASLSQIDQKTFTLTLLIVDYSDDLRHISLWPPYQNWGFSMDLKILEIQWNGYLARSEYGQTKTNSLYFCQIFFSIDHIAYFINFHKLGNSPMFQWEWLYFSHCLKVQMT
jgi:hypothetical protein